MYKEFFAKNSDTALLIPCWNEGERIQTELNRIKQKNIPNNVDIFILDGDSTDGSVENSFLLDMKIRGIFTIKEKGQGSSYRIGFAKVVYENYKYCITVDGNNKDSVEQIPEFIELLKNGIDFVQGSRFIKGGHHKNTPLMRFLAIKFFSNPLLSIVSGFKYSETMSAFRGFNVDILKDARLDIFRDIFKTWELQWYLASRIPRLGYKVKEIPTSRIYPDSGKTPTKINWRGNIKIIIQLLKVAFGYYNPK